MITDYTDKLHARVLAELHLLEAIRSKALDTGNRKEYDRATYQMKLRIQAWKSADEHMEEEKKGK